MSGEPLVLVADSDRFCRKLITNLLRRVGFETAEVETGPEALEQVARLQPRLILLEVNVAAVNGYTVCRELRDEYANDIAVIFISGERTTPADRVAGLLVGADDYITKPFDDDELLARVRAALRLSHPTAPRASQRPPLSATCSPHGSVRFWGYSLEDSHRATSQRICSSVRNRSAGTSNE